MKRKDKVIGVKTDEGTDWHFVNVCNGPDHHTLCELDADDFELGHYGVVEPDPSNLQKVNCPACLMAVISVQALTVTVGDFDDELRHRYVTERQNRVNR